MWLGQAAGGVLHFTTYNYQNLNNGAGLANVIYNVNHKNRHLAWHFIYYGYSRTERKIRGYVKFRTDAEEFVIESINHFLAK